MEGEIVNIFELSSLEVKNLLGSEVEIQCINKKLFTGTFYLLDPTSKTIVLMTEVRENRESSFTMVTSHGLKTFKIINANDRKSIVDSSLMSCNQDDPVVLTRKKKLKEWLIQNGLEIEECGYVLKYGEHLVIEAPYTVENCYCSNVIILERIRNIIDKMPTK